MARIINRPIRVRTDGRGTPREFFYRGRRRVVEVTEWWKETGGWWEYPVDRTVYRVQTAAGGLFEIEYRRPDGLWYLYKAYD